MKVFRRLLAEGWDTNPVRAGSTLTASLLFFAGLALILIRTYAPVVVDSRIVYHEAERHALERSIGTAHLPITLLSGFLLSTLVALAVWFTRQVRKENRIRQKIVLCALGISSLLTLGIFILSLPSSTQETKEIPRPYPPNSADVDAPFYMDVGIGSVPRFLRPHDSVTFECSMKWLGRDSALQRSYIFDVLGRPLIPIRLEESHSYAARLEFKAIGLDALPIGSEPGGSQMLTLGNELKWRWILSPKESRQGTNQAASVDLFIDDANLKKTVWVKPAVTLIIEVGTPLGLPSWLVSQQFTLGSVLSGAAAVVVPWLLTNFGPKRREKKSQRIKR